MNTCAFIEAARQESIDTVFELADQRRAGARLVVTGCMAERYGDELRDALPEVDLVAGFGRALTTAPATRDAGARRGGARRRAGAGAVRRPATSPSTRSTSSSCRARGPGPWAYVKVAEGCDRICGFCAIPSFRGKQRSRPAADVLAEVDALSGPRPPPAPAGRPCARSSWWPRTWPPTGATAAGPGRRARIAGGPSPIAALTRAVAARSVRTRLLYLYPSGLTDELIEAVLETGVPYFDLSLQHVSRPLLARMRRWGDGERFLRRIADIRAAEPDATFRSSFILGYPGETERDHDLLLEFLDAAQLDWAGFFPFSNEEGTHAAGLPDQVPAELALERLRECAELQDAITAAKRDALVGSTQPGARRRARAGPHGARGARDRRHRPRARRPRRSAASSTCSSPPPEGPDLHAAPRRRPLPPRRPAAAGAPRRERRRPEHPGHPAVRLRPERAGHAGQRRHRGPPPGRAGLRLMLVAWGASWINVVVGFVLAGSDGLDGYMARRHGTTRSGAFLDPLADKAVVLGALITLAAQGHLPWLPVVLITVREVGMQLYRSWVGRRGVSIPARNSAKLKTLVQDIAVGTCIIPPLAHQHGLQVAAIWFACALTLYTGAEYLLDGRRALHRPAAPKSLP